MEEITMSDSSVIVDPKVRAIVQRVTKQIQLSIEKVGANQQDAKKYPLATDPKSLEQIIAKRFRTLSEEKKKNALAKIMKRVNASGAERQAHYGDLAKIDLTKPVAIGAQAKALPFPAALKISADYLKNLTSIHDKVLLRTLTVQGGIPNAGGLAPQQTFTKLAFRLRYVRCVDRTSDLMKVLEDSDEMYVGGASVDENGDTKKVTDVYVKQFTYDGEQKTYSSPLTFTTFSITEGTDFPKTYFLSLIPYEKDMGGFADWLNDFLNSIKAEVAAALASAIALGLAIGASGGPMGALLGAAVSAAVSIGITLITSFFDDDIMGIASPSCTINSYTGTWSGNPYSPQHLVTFTKAGGQYQIAYDWIKLP